jgi:hypothetical protein
MTVLKKRRIFIAADFARSPKVKNNYDVEVVLFYEWRKINGFCCE